MLSLTTSSLTGFGGAAAPPWHIRDNFGLPLINFLPRAHQYLEEVGYRQHSELIAAGGLRTSGDFRKVPSFGGRRGLHRNSCALGNVLRILPHM